MKMAIVDAAEGRPRSFMQAPAALLRYDPEGKTYVLKVNRIILAVTLFRDWALLGFLLLRSKNEAGRAEGEPMA